MTDRESNRAAELSVRQARFLARKAQRDRAAAVGATDQMAQQHSVDPIERSEIKIEVRDSITGEKRKVARHSVVRRARDSRWIDPMSPDQLRAWGEIGQALHLIAGSQGYASLNLVTRAEEGDAPHTPTQAMQESRAAELQRCYWDWSRRMEQERHQGGVVIRLMVVDDRTLAQIDAALRKRSGTAKRLGYEALDAWAEERGWRRKLRASPVWIVPNAFYAHAHTRDHSRRLAALLERLLASDWRRDLREEDRRDAGANALVAAFTVRRSDDETLDRLMRGDEA